ncbi:MAG: MBL fold metallo-hydrolase [bacterium]
MKLIKVGKIKTRLIWFDSLGAKSSSVLVETPDLKLLIDPGASGMQPSYPLPEDQKCLLRRLALEAIKKAAKIADGVFVSHYHYDHHTLPLEALEIYEGKTLWMKDPNLWINRSQWERARVFLSQLYKLLKGKDLREQFGPSLKTNIEDPLNHLPLARHIDYGDYQKRKEELIIKGRRWFRRMVDLWISSEWVHEFSANHTEILFADGKAFRVGGTTLRFTRPLFHGIEYDRVGWVIGLVVECGGIKFLYSSDLQGPMLEDYAKWVIEEKPQILIMDGPATYLFGYMLNRINLNRAIANVKLILQETSPQVLIYDHHLPRDIRYRERVAEIYQAAEKDHKKVLTAAEWFGREPLILRLKREVR